MYATFVRREEAEARAEAAERALAEARAAAAAATARADYAGNATAVAQVRPTCTLYVVTGYIL